MTDQLTAFALAGAGTKGAFEVGALRYLVGEAAVVPQIITATSAGAILGTVLAQARNPEEFAARTEELAADLMAMTSTDLVFAKQPWLAEFDGTSFGDAVDAYLTTGERPPVPPDPTESASSASGPVGSGGDDQVAPSVTKRAKHHRMHALLTALEALPAARRARGDLKGHAGSLLTLDPLEAALRTGGTAGITPIDPAEVGRPGLQLRLTVTALGRGRTRYVTEDGTIVEADAVTPVSGPGAGPVSVIDGLLASSTVPMVFEPRPMGDDVYVDGGVLQNVPVEAAVRLGAGRIIAVLGVPIEDPPDPRDFTEVNFVGVFLRAVSQIGFFERQRSNLATPLPDGGSLTVIAPTLDVVGPFEVAQGLMVLDMDYGWMRAADILVDQADDRADVRADDQADDRRRRGQELSDAITAGRERAWYHEEDLWAAGTASPADLERLRRIKDQVRRALVERQALGLAVPDGARHWWLGYETHAAVRPPGLPDDPWDGSPPP